MTGQQPQDLGLNIGIRGWKLTCLSVDLDLRSSLSAHTLPGVDTITLFSDGKTEAQRDEVNCQGPTAEMWQG